VIVENLSSLTPMGGHTWPGAAARVWIPPIFSRTATIDASRLIWEFLSVHRRG
jgi:poly(3-hydroxybutyrate) depolymerase